MTSDETVSVPRGRAAGRPAYHHGDLESALVRAARELLETEGPDALSVRRLASAVGVSPSAPYKHFRDAEDVLAALATDGFVRLRQALDPGEADGTTQVTALADAYLDHAVASPGVYAVMFSPTLDHSRHPELAAASHAALRLLLDAVSAATGVTQEQAWERAVALWVTLHGYAALAAQDRLGPGGPGLRDRVVATAVAAATAQDPR